MAKAKKQIESNFSFDVLKNIQNVIKEKKENPAVIEIAIPGDLAEKLTRFNRCPDGLPKILSMSLTWEENITDVLEEAEEVETKSAE